MIKQPSIYRGKVLQGYYDIIGSRPDTWTGLNKWVSPKEIAEFTGIKYRTVLYHCQKLTICNVFTMRLYSDKYAYFCSSIIPDGYRKGKRRNNWNRIRK